MIIRPLIAIALIFCLGSCTNTQAERNKEARALFKVISEREKVRNIDTDIPISDRFGRFPFKTFWSETLQYDEKIDDFVEADDEYINHMDGQLEKLKKDNINCWSKTNIEIGKNLVDITIFDKYDVFQKEWWDIYTKKYQHNAIRFYSYPIFNKEYTKAYIVFSCYNKEQHKTIPPYIYIYIKNEQGQWEYISEEPLY